jgi:hypothetical protein
MTIREQDRGDYVIKVVVCSDCNNWMNSTFENPTRDLLNELRAGRQAMLSPDDQARLADWLTKTVLMLNLWSEFDQDQYLTPGDYRRFRDETKHPAGTRIWLASIEDADPTREAAVVHAVPALRENAAAPRSWMFPFGSSAHIFSFDHLVVLWIRDNRPEEASRAPGDPRVLIRRCVRRGLLVPVWPAAPETLTWPPAVPFDVTTYERWSRLFAWR